MLIVDFDILAIFLSSTLGPCIIDLRRPVKKINIMQVLQTNEIKPSKSVTLLAHVSGKCGKYLW